MILRRLGLRAFRNYAEATLEPSARLTVLWGENAQGKTNLLEAIYVLATTQSFRTTRTSDLIAEGASEAILDAEIEGLAGSSRLRMTLRPGAKRLLRDAKPARSRRDWLGILPAVIFCPEDLMLVRGPAEGRRRALDLALSAVSASYYDHLRDFQKALQQRNALLKAERFDRGSFEAWTETFVLAGAEVTRRRLRYLREITPLVTATEGEISAGGPAIAFAYEPSAGTADPEEPEFVARYRASVAALERDERRRGMSLAGPQRDDWRVELAGRDLKAYGSQGQHRTFVIALKLAEARHLKAALGTDPLFLLDDVSSELDPGRSERLLAKLLASPYQVLVTTTRRDLFDRREAGDLLRFRVRHGALLLDP